MAASNNSVPSISTKLTGLVDNVILEKMNEAKGLSQEEEKAKQKLLDRIDSICSRAAELGVGVLIDAEESWMQIAIDDVVELMMSKYNKEKVIVFNTYQLYRHDKLQQLKDDHKKASASGYLLGAKFVRGAYMDKERNRAEEHGYASPIHKNKDDVDTDYEKAIHYCVKNYESIGSICATHNIKSNLLQAQLIEQHNIPSNHPHLNFCQLYGMQDIM